MNKLLTLNTIVAIDAYRASVDDELELPYAARQHSRQRVSLKSGRDAGINLPRGSVLRGGMLLAGDGQRVRVNAAPETVSVARGSALELLRAAYHLGNRHVAVHLDEAWLAYLHDHVLDRMVRGLGLSVTTAEQAFEPEPGAYSGAGHQHGSEPEQTQSHAHGLTKHHAHG